MVMNGFLSCFILWISCLVVSWVSFSFSFSVSMLSSMFLINSSCFWCLLF